MWKTISNLFIRLIEFQTDYTYIYTTYNLKSFMIQLSIHT